MVSVFDEIAELVVDPRSSFEVSRSASDTAHVQDAAVIPGKPPTRLYNLMLRAMTASVLDGLGGVAPYGSLNN